MVSVWRHYEFISDKPRTQNYSSLIKSTWDVNSRRLSLVIRYYRGNVHSRGFPKEEKPDLFESSSRSRSRDRSAVSAHRFGAPFRSVVSEHPEREFRKSAGNFGGVSPGTRWSGAREDRFTRKTHLGRCHQAVRCDQQQEQRTL